jgi:hypothetical protein
MVASARPGRVFFCFDKKNISTDEHSVFTINLSLSLDSPSESYMRKPDESLSDYIVKPVRNVDAKPPRPVILRVTGDVQSLKPLIQREIGVGVGVSRTRSGFQPLWFRRLIAVGSGALVLIAVVLVSAILIGIKDTVSEPELAMNGSPDITQTEDSISFESYAPSSPTLMIGRGDIVRASYRRRSPRPSIRLVAYKPRRQRRPVLRPTEPEFFPTTLVIYAENGAINTRVEPWIQTLERKTLTFNN